MNGSRATAGILSPRQNVAKGGVAITGYKCTRTYTWTQRTRSISKGDSSMTREARNSRQMPDSPPTMPPTHAPEQASNGYAYMSRAKYTLERKFLLIMGMISGTTLITTDTRQRSAACQRRQTLSHKQPSRHHHYGLLQHPCQRPHQSGSPPPMPIAMSKALKQALSQRPR